MGRHVRVAVVLVALSLGLVNGLSFSLSSSSSSALLGANTAADKWAPVQEALQDRWNGTTLKDLWAMYPNVIPSRNRNAAAFRWSSFLLSHSAEMPSQRFEKMFSGFCPVSAATVAPSNSTAYRLKLKAADGGGDQEGILYLCCWPAICDAVDLIKVDTKTVKLDGTEKKYQFAVMGDPCRYAQALRTPYTDARTKRVTTLAEQAPTMVCGSDGRLFGASFSDHGHVILSMFHKDLGQPAHDAKEFTDACGPRGQTSFEKAVGAIFRRVAAIAPA